MKLGEGKTGFDMSALSEGGVAVRQPSFPSIDVSPAG
jgi:hypothetical protein